jgi:hypothetical protein
MRLPKLTGAERVKDPQSKQPGRGLVYPQGCNPIQCVGAVAQCWGPCTSGDVGACISCLGPLYAACKDCFSF